MQKREVKLAKELCIKLREISWKRLKGGYNRTFSLAT